MSWVTTSPYDYGRHYEQGQEYLEQLRQQYRDGGLVGITGKTGSAEKEKKKKEKSLTYCKRCGEKLVMSDLRTHYDEYTGDTLGKKVLGCPNNKGWLSMGHTRFTQDKYGDWVRCEIKINWAKFWDTLGSVLLVALAFTMLAGLCYGLYLSSNGVTL